MRMTQRLAAQEFEVQWGPDQCVMMCFWSPNEDKSNDGTEWRELWDQVQLSPNSDSALSKPLNSFTLCFLI